MVSAPGRRRQVLFAKARGLSVHRACALLGGARSAPGYESRLPERDKPVIEELKKIAQERPWFGYRRAWALLRRTALKINPKRVHRLWKSAGLKLSQKRPRDRARLGTTRQPAASGINSV